MNPWILRCMMVAGVLSGLAGCKPAREPSWQGYLTGDYVFVSSPVAGRLVDLKVARGQRLAAGEPLFDLDPQPEEAALGEAVYALDAARATLADMEKGKRPPEIASLQHAQTAVEAAQVYVDLQLKRSKDLYRTKVVAEENLNLYQSADVVLQEAVAALKSLIASWQLGGREDQIAAQRALAGAAEKQVEQARWALTQKSVTAPVEALVFDTLYREGEWVSAGSPVVRLLPPEGVRARFFVSGNVVGSLAIGQKVNISAAGLPGVEGRITFVSPQAEYAPPVIYSRGNDAKLVFLVEADFDPGAARNLHPGQPVVVRPSRP